MFITPLELWKSLGKDAVTKVRAEIVGTGDGSTSSFSLDHDNVVSGSDSLYTDSTLITSSAYSIDLDDGDITGLTASSDSVLTADYHYADIPDSHVQNILSRAEAELTDSTGRDFQTASTSEYIDVENSTQDEYFLNNWPVTTISALTINTASSVTDSPSWQTLTQGLGNDFISNTEDLKNGSFRFIDNFPFIGKDRIKVTYNHGSATHVRADELELLLATRQMINSTIYQSIFKGRDAFSPVRLEEIENRIKELTRSLKKINIERP